MSDFASKLLSNAELADKYNQLGKEYQYPYLVRVLGNNQCLYFLGCHHSFDPKDPQHIRIENLWNEFLEIAKDNAVVMIEGGLRPNVNNRDEAISRHGEAGLVTHLASTAKIYTYSPEPSDKEEVDILLTMFEKDEISYYRFARTVLQWNKLVQRPEFDDYVNKFLNRDKENLGWNDFDFSTQHMIDIHNAKFDHTFDPMKCENCVYKTSSPIENSISAASNMIRDKMLVSSIQSEWVSGKNIFVAYGSGHVLTCERAVKEILV